jgi:signal-transduction protein with cAMP-binding, CBS, and nucleotidyltransferase domain
MSAVSEIMSDREIVTIVSDSGKTARDAAQLMVQRKVSSVIVIDMKTQPLGILTERDLVKKVIAKNISPVRIGIEEIMSSPLLTVMSYDSVDTASRILTKNKIKRLAVLEGDNRIAGMLSVTDITRFLAKILVADYQRYRSLKFAIDLVR